MTKSKRHLVLVDPSFQLRYAFVLGLSGVLAGLGCAAGLFEINRRARMDLALPPGVLKELTAQDANLLWAAILLAALGGGLLLAVGIVLSLRMAGPVYALSQYASALAQGYYPPTRNLRDGDQFRELFDVFVKAIEALRAKDVEEVQKIDGVIHQLEHGKWDERAPSVETLKALVQRKREATLRVVGKPGGRS